MELTWLVRIMCANLTARISNKGFVIGGSFFRGTHSVVTRLYGTTNQLKTTIAQRRNRLVT